MKYFTTILTILGIYLFVYACSEKPCTDDGCPEFYDDRNGSHTVEVDDIEQWMENPAATTLNFKTISLEF